MTSRALFVASWILFAFLISASWAAEPPATPPKGDTPEKIVFAATPFKDPEAVQKSYAPLMEYLSQALGKTVAIWDRSSPI